MAAGSALGALSAFGCGGGSRRLEDAGDPALLDLRAASREVRAGALSPVELTRACLERIERCDPELDAFITVTGESALGEARRAAAEIAEGRWRGPLHGIPIALKDNVDTAGVRTTAASAVFAERVPEEDAEVVQRLRSAGAVFLGKLNLHEFALGTTSAVSAFGAVHNPWDLSRVAGGSSGGCGAAVAASLCYGAIGTDTGGSVRIPAACCGVVGFKPSYGLISTRGVVPISTAFDHVGPLARSVGDAALMCAAMSAHPALAGYDVEAPPPVDGLRVGMLATDNGVCDSEVQPEVQEVFDAALDVLRGLVAEVRAAQLPMLDPGLLIDAEAYEYHAPWLADPTSPYDPRTRAGLLIGKDVDPDEVVRLRHLLDQHRAAVGRAFDAIDLVVVPTLPVLPPRIEDCFDPFALPACTFGFSLGGLPCLSLPCGFSRGGLPIGLLIGGPALADQRVLALAQAFESATGWSRYRPSI